MTDFQHELEILLNRYSKDSETNTPDWVLAQYLVGCLDALKVANEKTSIAIMQGSFQSMPTIAEVEGRKMH